MARDMARISQNIDTIFIYLFCLFGFVFLEVFAPLLIVEMTNLF